jgi:hypothetical protein
METFQRRPIEAKILAQRLTEPWLAAEPDAGRPRFGRGSPHAFAVQPSIPAIATQAHTDGLSLAAPPPPFPA